MAIPVSCVCGQAFRANDTMAGKQAKCPKCGSILTIPQLAPPPNQLAGFQGGFPAQAPQNTPTGFGAPTPMQQSPLTSSSPMMGQPGFGAAQTPWQTQQSAPNKKKKKGSNRGLLIGLVAGGSALVVAAVVTVVLIIVLRGDDKDEVAGSSGSGGSSSGSTFSVGGNSAGGSDDLYQQHESKIQELLSEFENFQSTLESITDRDSAAAAVSEIDRVRERVPQLLREGKALPRLSRTQDSELKRRYDSRMRGLQSKIASEMQRAMFRSKNEPQFVSAIQRLGQDWQHLGRF